ncbi:hypothetical protein [Pseudomonas veronii]
MSLQVKQQIVAVQFDGVDADPVDQQGQESDDNRSSYQPFAIANSHRRTPFFFCRRTHSCVACHCWLPLNVVAKSSSPMPAKAA